MTTPDSANGHLPQSDPAENAQIKTDAPVLEQTPTKRPPKKKRPNWNLIHSRPLPLEVHPLPAFHPTNPISLLRLAYAYLSQLFDKPVSQLPQPYIGYFSPETRSVHVTDPKHARALWEMGFFGKGTLSRSEMSWLDREKARLLAKRAGGGGTAEENTNARREKRRLFKLERARAEAEKIERQRLVEEGKLDPSVLETEGTEIESGNEHIAVEATPRPLQTTAPDPAVTLLPPQPSDIGLDDDDEEEPIPDFDNQEHLQLTLEEAFFLSYGLGALEIRPDSANNIKQNHSYSGWDLLQTCSAHGFFPTSRSIDQHNVRPDDQFLLSYVVYHHFRSLGWVVRQGVKFSVDYLLYYRGPVFSHAEFAVIIIPAYTAAYWSTEQGKRERRIRESHDWWWTHCVNRVQSQALKTLVMVYVNVPAPAQGDQEKDIGALLRSYKVREFVIKRWTPNRSRD
ncbi:Putative tRNA-splicing endonuclease, tRNA intron endonuclease, catalytic domain-containing protein [Septoria linicola]|uniref:tRNA-splicing endonuclease subunit Sen2 n=1 Tax=Septoria linicola TaxID=215465 RepID=A0A9Q9EJJ5_9PEZI|nr:Putative tRNA-splicing endonuclease, tRNA intron endonuclease, catalytic domain-containing protein [Septoria linicola]